MKKSILQAQYLARAKLPQSITPPMLLCHSSHFHKSWKQSMNLKLLPQPVATVDYRYPDICCMGHFYRYISCLTLAG